MFEQKQNGNFKYADLFYFNIKARKSLFIDEFRGILTLIFKNLKKQKK